MALYFGNETLQQKMTSLHKNSTQKQLYNDGVVHIGCAHNYKKTSHHRYIIMIEKVFLYSRTIRHHVQHINLFDVNTITL